MVGGRQAMVLVAQQPSCGMPENPRTRGEALDVVTAPALTEVRARSQQLLDDRARAVSTALRAYAALAQSADRGAVRALDR